MNLSKLQMKMSNHTIILKHTSIKTDAQPDNKPLGLQLTLCHHPLNIKTKSLQIYIFLGLHPKNQEHHKAYLIF